MQIRQSLQQLTPYLLFCACVFLQGALLFGIDTGSFGSLQALPSFLNTFGDNNGSGTYVLSTQRKSIMNSVPWIGKIAGTIVVEPGIERLGYKKMMYIVAVIQLASLISESRVESRGCRHGSFWSSTDDKSR